MAFASRSDLFFALLLALLVARPPLAARAADEATPSSPAGTTAAAAPATDPARREGLVRRGERELTLLGPGLVIGQPAPTAELRDTKQKKLTPAFDDGKPRIILLVPSIDTPTCSLQTRQFNERAAALGEAVEVLVISRDLPFAQERFCAAHGIDRVRPLSDFVAGAFGRGWGLYIEETDLLARAVVITDGKGIVRYQQVVENLPDEPDYDSALAAFAGVVTKAQ
jgi:thiol peroxidase